MNFTSFRGPQGGRRTLNSPNQVRILAPDQLETKEVRPCPNPAVPVQPDNDQPPAMVPDEMSGRGSCLHETAGGWSPDGAVRS